MVLVEHASRALGLGGAWWSWMVLLVEQGELGSKTKREGEVEVVVAASSSLPGRKEFELLLLLLQQTSSP